MLRTSATHQTLGMLIMALLLGGGCNAPVNSADSMEPRPTLSALANAAADAPGAPGIGSAWTTGAKQGLGTSTTAASKIWYTLGQGITHEIYYPQADIANVQDLQYVVTDGASFMELERDATTHEIQLVDPKALEYRQINTATSGRYRITKTYVTDPNRATLLVRTRFQVLSGGALQLYVLFNPSLNNSGMGDTGATVGGKLVASDGPVASALAASTGFSSATNGYSGTSSDGYNLLKNDHRLSAIYETASSPGNLVQTAQIPVGADTSFTLALAFDADRTKAAAAAQASLDRGFTAVESAYKTGWRNYLASIAPPPASVATMTTQFQVAAMTLKAHEDKTYTGAFVASLTVPWGQAINADNENTAGYHAVWARDLYQMGTASIAIGDSAAANRALDYLFKYQLRADGSYPQNARLDGTPVWGSLQLDEVAFPAILAWQLGRNDATTYANLKKSADFLLAHGPATPQERWEEAGGYSPSTLAAEIAGLICTSDIARANGDTASANRFRDAAKSWWQNIENWTLTRSGHLDSRPYYERIDDNGNPNDGHNLSIANGGGNHDERDVVDAGFLELVRLGVKPANDPNIAASLAVVDRTIRVNTPVGAMWYRYNHDGYGEPESGGPYTGAGKGRLWPIFSGERGEYELANGRSATSYLATMAGSANKGFLIPEQAWDGPDAHGFVFGKGTDSATPLAWSMAQFVRLAVSISAGKNVETPAIVPQTINQW